MVKSYNKVINIRIKIYICLLIDATLKVTTPADVQPTTSLMPTITDSGTFATVTVSSCTARLSQASTLTSSRTNVNSTSTTLSLCSNLSFNNDFDHVSLEDSVIEKVVDENDSLEFTQLSHPTIEQKSHLFSLGHHSQSFLHHILWRNIILKRRL